MKKLMRMLKILSYAIFIILASVGVGIGGAILPPVNKRKNDNDILIEQKDERNESEELTDLDAIK